MSKPSKRKRPVDLLARLHTLEAQLPLTPEERAAMLPPPEVIAASLKSVMQKVEDQQAREAEARMAARRAGRDAAVQKIRESTQRRSRAENLALIAALRNRSPAHAQRVALFRDFKSAPDEDLDLLVAALQALPDAKKK